MKPAIQWFRIPTWADLFDANEQNARDARAVVRLLRDWHLGADPNEYQFRTLNGFGAGRSIRLYYATLAWAKEAGAAFPERLLNVTGQKLDVRRTTVGQRSDHSEAGATPEVSEQRTTNGQPTDSDRTISRARVLLERREKSEGADARAASPVPDSPRSEVEAGAAGAPPHGAHPSIPEATPDRESPPTESHPPVVKSATVTPPPLPPTEDAPLTVDGIELPRDLPALLSTITPGFMHYIRLLLPAGVTTTEHLLRVPREEWKFMGHGLNAAKVNAIGDHLRTAWGVEFGALAKATTKPSPRLPAQPRPQGQTGEPLALANYLRDRRANRPPVAAVAAKES